MEAKPPRKQTLSCNQKSLPDDIFAIVRLAWFEDGQAIEVDEIQIMEAGDDTISGFAALIGQALRQGADVSVLSAYPPEDLGIYEE